MDTIGVHLLIDLSGCNPAMLSCPEAIQHALRAAAADANATALEGYFHQFEPNGVSGLLCLAESHISIHTWPDRGYAGLDIYTCGETTTPHRAVTLLATILQAKHVHLREVTRGVEIEPNQFFSKLVGPPLEHDLNDAKTGCVTSSDKCSWYVEDADAHERHLYAVSKWLVSSKSKFQQIGIVANRSYGRILFLDGAVQSSERDEYMYHETLIHPGMMLHPKPEKVLILGGGEGASLREVLKHKSVKQCVMVDIDGELVDECRKHLPEWSAGSYNDPRTQVLIADGKDYIETTKEKFDIIFMDLTDQIDLGPSFALYTQQFYKRVQERLNPGGFFVVQAGELSACEFYSHSAIRQTLKTVFPHVETYIQHIPTFFAQWSFVIASTAPLSNTPSIETLDKAVAERIKTPLKFYDGETHHRIFMLPKDIKKLLAKNGIVVTNEHDFAEAYEASLAIYQD